MDWLFAPAQLVVCRRDRRLLMRVNEQPYSENNATEFYVATPAEEHAGAGRGKSTRYWREDDLVAA